MSCWVLYHCLMEGFFAMSFPTPATLEVRSPESMRVPRTRLPVIAAAQVLLVVHLCVFFDYVFCIMAVSKSASANILCVSYRRAIPDTSRRS